MVDNALDELLSAYHENGDLMSLLKAAQAHYGGLTPDVVGTLAARIGMTAGDLYGVVTFYDFLSKDRIGRHTIKVCKCVPCRMNDAETTRAALERELGIRSGQTTPDGRFTLRTTNCIGACGQGPSMMVDDHRFTRMTDGKIAAVLAEFE